jgi:hypothetical protein
VWVSRCVGELVSKRAGGRGSSWSTLRLTILTPAPSPLRLRRCDGIPAPLVSLVGLIPERGPPEAPVLIVLCAWELLDWAGFYGR